MDNSVTCVSLWIIGSSGVHVFLWFYFCYIFVPHSGATRLGCRLLSYEELSFNDEAILLTFRWQESSHLPNELQHLYTILYHNVFRFHRWQWSTSQDARRHESNRCFQAHKCAFRDRLLILLFIMHDSIHEWWKNLKTLPDIVWRVQHYTDGGLSGPTICS